MSATLMTNLRYVVTADDAASVLHDVSLLLDEGMIVAIGPLDQVEALAPPGASRIDGRERLALPGLVNLHTHLPMTLLRGLAEHVDLQGFLTIVWAAEAAVMDRDTVELGATLGALESLRSGVTTALDMYFFHEEAHRGAVAAGLRHVGGPVFFDGPGPDGLSWGQRLDALRSWPQRLAEIAGPVVPVAALPHGTYTNSPAHLAEVAGVLAALPGRRLLCTHASENPAENADVVAQHGASPVGLLDAAGWLPRGAGTGIPVVLGHGVHLDESDLATLAAAEAAVAHCPGSNLKLASGALPWTTWREAGVRLGLGTDGASSSNDLDLWQTMRQAALLAAHTAGDPAAVTPAEIVRAATIDGARALGLGDLVGSIEVGKEADVVLIDLEAPHLTPVHDAHALLVYAAGRGDVTDVFVAGERVVAERRSTRLDEHDLLARVRQRALLAADATGHPPV